MMLPERYRLTAESIRVDLAAIDAEIAHAREAVALLHAEPSKAEHYTRSAALVLHSAYTGIEDILLQIAREVDDHEPQSHDWHRALVRQMALQHPEVRPPVLSPGTAEAVLGILSFRHLVRHIYASRLDSARVERNVNRLLAVQDSLRADLLAFADWLDEAAS